MRATAICLTRRSCVHYDSQNLLARSLHEHAYDHNPGFRRFHRADRPAFPPARRFRKADLDDRQELYGQLAEYIWNPGRLEAAAVRSDT